MSRLRLLAASDAWFRLLLFAYPPEFRDELGESWIDTYRDRARVRLVEGGGVAWARVCLRALGDALWSGTAERLRPASAWRSIGWGRDAGIAWRRLRRSPAFVAATLSTLTIGLGAFAVVFAVVHHVLLSPMPYREDRDLYFVWRDYGPMFDLQRGWLAGTDVADLQQGGGIIEGAAAIMRQRLTFALREGAEPMEISALAVSPNLFDLLGVAPAAGRGLASGEEGPSSPRVLVLSHDLWNRLGAEASMLGTMVRVNGQDFTVIGVMPAGFAFVHNPSLGRAQRVDAFVPLTVRLADTRPGSGSYAGLVRARRGTPSETVAAVVDGIGRSIDARHFQSRGLRLYAVGLKDDLVAPVRPVLWVLGASGVLLVLVLGVNLASALLARAAQREQEIAVSRALGANGVAVGRATLVEGALLGLAGGIAGTLVAVWGTRALVALAADLPRREAVAVDVQVTLIVVATGLAMGLLAAAVPAAWAARASLTSLLAATSVRGGGGHGRMRQGMVVLQVALSLVLLSSGGLVVRSFDRLLRIDPGFRPDGVLTFRLPIPSQVVPEAAEAIAIQDRVTLALSSLPGVGSVSAVDALPLTASTNQNVITIPGAPGNTGVAEHDRPLVDSIAIRAGYVEVMGLQLLEGRTPSERPPSDVREGLIDDHVAEYFFPTGSALGATIPLGNDGLPLTIVGVVRHARMYDIHEDGLPQVYLRAEDFGYRTLSFVLRTTMPPASLAKSVRAAIHGVDPRLAVADLRPMDAIVLDAVRERRLSAVLLSGFAVTALLLSAMGLFSIVSGSVTRRRHEFAVRLALGAHPRGVLRLALQDGARLIAAGALLGLPGAYAAGRLVRGVLEGIPPFDVLTVATVTAGLATVTLIACYVPARRALTIQPAQSLRTE